MHRIRSGEDDQAWDRFVRLYTPLIFRWASRLGMLPHEAVDLVQEVFVILVQKLPHFEYDPYRSFRAWLCTIARNAGRDFLRRRASRRSAELGNSGELPERLLAEDDAEVFAEREFQGYLAARALQLMKADFAPVAWQAFWGLVVERRPAVELATELEISQNAVYLAKARVLRRLREELAGMDF